MFLCRDIGEQRPEEKNAFIRKKKEKREEGEVHGWGRRGSGDRGKERERERERETIKIMIDSRSRLYGPAPSNGFVGEANGETCGDRERESRKESWG